jgi:hypothetical protein
MKTWRDLTIASKSMDAEALVGLLRQFGSGGGVWAYSVEMSADYAKSLSGPACIIEWMESDRPRKHTVALAATDSCRVLRLAAIGPSTLDEYNFIAAQFAEDLKRWVRHTGNDICVKLGRTDVGLEQLISSKRARDLFVRYLDTCRWCGELATHPSDLKVLDLFTCSVHTYSRKPVDLCELERYLEEDCMWSAADSRRCIERIEIGLQVLRAYSPHMSDRRLYRPS